MGSKEQFNGILPRATSILVDFRWNKKRYRESLALHPSPANLRYAKQIRTHILNAIDLDAFSWSDFATYFPKSPHLIVAAPKIVLEPTFREIATDWLTMVGPTVAHTTLDEYSRALARYFLPVYGSRPMVQIAYEELALYIAGLPLTSAKTFNNVMTPARGVFRYAVRTGKITRDIAAEIESRSHQPPGPDPLEADEVIKVLRHIEATNEATWHNYFEFAIFSGMRPSEQIALKWSTVDFKHEQALVKTARVRARDKDTKNHKARYIDLQTRALAALKRQAQLTYSLEGNVFINPRTKRPFSSTAAPIDIWRPTLRELNIRHRDARQTRHTFATLCLHAGMNPAYISRQMGHVNAKMFFEVYARWIDGKANKRETAKMDAFLVAETSNNTVPNADFGHVVDTICEKRT